MLSQFVSLSFRILGNAVNVKHKFALASFKHFVVNVPKYMKNLILSFMLIKCVYL